MKTKTDGLDIWIASFIIGICSLVIGAIIYVGLNNYACGHPPEDCFKKGRTHPAQAVVLSPKKPYHKNRIKAFQKRQLLKETGKWDKDTLSSCKSICLKLGDMEEK